MKSRARETRKLKRLYMKLWGFYPAPENRISPKIRKALKLARK